MYDYFREPVPIEATYNNARKVVTLSRQDILNADPFLVGHPNVPNPDNETMVLDQQAKLRKHPKYYMGTFAINTTKRGDYELTSFIKRAPQRPADVLPFITDPYDRTAVRIMDILRIPRMPGAPIEIFGLVADQNTDGTEQAHNLNELIRETLTMANKKETYIPIHDNDPVLPIILDRGFMTADDYGRGTPYLDFPQTLYVHTPRTFEPYHSLKNTS